MLDLPLSQNLFCMLLQSSSSHFRFKQIFRLLLLLPLLSKLLLNLGVVCIQALDRVSSSVGSGTRVHSMTMYTIDLARHRDEVMTRGNSG